MRGVWWGGKKLTAAKERVYQAVLKHCSKKSHAGQWFDAAAIFPDDKSSQTLFCEMFVDPVVDAEIEVKQRSKKKRVGDIVIPCTESLVRCIPLTSADAGVPTKKARQS